MYLSPVISYSKVSIPNLVQIDVKPIVFHFVSRGLFQSPFLIQTIIEDYATPHS
jgi:hypothetical protein